MGERRGRGQRTLPSGGSRPGLGALRSALHVTAVGPRGRRTRGGRGRSRALGPSRPASGFLLEPGAGTWSSRGRGRDADPGCPRRRGLEAKLAKGPSRVPRACH